MGVLLPRGGVLSIGILELLAIDLEENEPALLTVTALYRTIPYGTCLGALATVPRMWSRRGVAEIVVP